MKKFIFLLVVLALIGAGIYVLFFAKQDINVKLSIEKPEEVLMGEPFNLKVVYNNNSPESLKNARISIYLPENVYILGRDQNQRANEDFLGDVDPLSSSYREYSFVALQDFETAKRIEAKLIYSLEGSGALFESETKTDIVIGRPALILDMKTPEGVFSGEGFEMELSYKNNSQKEIKDVKVKMDYPPAFTFSESLPQPSFNKNEWYLGDVPPGEEGKITIKGNAIGEESADFIFNSYVFSEISGEQYEIQKQSASVAIKEAPLSIKIRVNDDDDYVARAGQELSYVLYFKNNSGTALQNIIIKATLSGEMYNLSTVRSAGAFNSTNNTITWNVASLEDLKNLEQGKEGSAEFSVMLKDDFPIKRLSDKNYSLKVNAYIESPTVPAGVSAQKTISVARMETKIAGDINLEAKALYKETDAEIKNSGPYPPKVNKATTYTVHWKITNFSTDVSSVRVSAFVQGDTKFTGKVKSNSDSVPVFNSRTGEVSWEIKTIPATKGLIGEAYEAIFQLENTPAVNQVRQDVTILSSSRLSARDDFTNITLEDSESSLTTAVPLDKGITIENRVVSQ